MISHAHIESLREQVAQAERHLAGWRYLLAHAEQVERSDAAAKLPDPGMGVGQPWPVPAAEPWQPHPGLCACGEPSDPAKYHSTGRCDLIPPDKGGPDVYPAASAGEQLRVDPYPTSVMPSLGALPRNQERALDKFNYLHNALDRETGDSEQRDEAS